MIPARLTVPGLLTILLLASQVFAVPPLTDPVSGAVPSSLIISVPRLYLLLAPLFTLWDGISMLSMSRLQGFLMGMTALYVLWRVGRLLVGRYSSSRWLLRELGMLLLSIAVLLCFLLTGAVWHRPMISLAGVGPNLIVVDFHSHTAFSHDVGGTWMRGFDVPANLRWHARAGFDAVFVTDHNTIEGIKHSQQYPALCPGIEVSAWKAHIVMLGDTLPVNRERYSRSFQGLLELLSTSESAFGALTVASLPEYRRNHWNRLDTLIAAGLDGFEIVNASPKANDLTRLERDRVVELARANNLLVLGVSDSHGWGATSMVWNLVGADPGAPGSGKCHSILAQLYGGFSAVRVIERHRLRPDDGWPLWLTPLGVVWATWRSMGWPLALSWLAWIWLLWTIPILLRTRRLRVKIAQSPSSGLPPSDH